MVIAALLKKNQPATHMHKFSVHIKKSLESRHFGVFSFVCREGTNLSCMAAQECFILHLNYTGFWLLTCNICTNCCNILQHTPIIPSGSTVQIFTSVVNTPPPTPYLLHWVTRNWSGKKLPKGRAEARLAQNTTLVFAQFEILWRTPEPQWGPSAWHPTAHWPHTASGIQTFQEVLFGPY